MPNPYRILDVTPESADEEIRQAYVAKVRRHTPEQDPRGFEETRQSYEKLKDARSRLRYLLFELPRGESFEELLEEIRRRCAEIDSGKTTLPRV